MKVRKILAVLLAAAALLVTLCLWKVAPLFGVNIFPQSPQSYAEYALRFMNNGMYSGSKEWKTARESALEAIKGAKSYAETYPVLEEAVKVAGGKHSFFHAPADSSEKSVAETLLPSVTEEDGILLITLPEFVGTTEEGKAYADAVLSALREHPAPDGVILDLRGNTGGDMGPMVTAVSPLLPDGELMHFAIHGQKNPVTLSEGTVTGGGSSLKVDGFKLDGFETIPIAILTDDHTASSGEALLLCFRGLDNVKTFGEPTAGYASCNNVLTLRDGAVLAITMGKDVARTGEEFCDDPIEPDVETASPAEDAVAWLRS